MPASLPVEAVPSKLVIPEDDPRPLNLLLVGRDYVRKGVDIALQLVTLLNKNGLRAHLRIVGLDGTDGEAISYHGLFDKGNAAHLESYTSHYRWAHFLVHPAYFEAAGIVPSEAAAFGVPTITNNSGGLATTVKEGVSGIVLPRQSAAEDYCEVLRHYAEHPDDYRDLRRTTRQRYEEELNWEVTGSRIQAVIEDAVKAGV